MTLIFIDSCRRVIRDSILGVQVVLLINKIGFPASCCAGVFGANTYFI